MLRVLLAKDLRRAWRNPLPTLINIALPICITALIGVVFGGRDSNELERIKFAVVDEDQSFLSNMLRGAMNQKQGGEHLDPVFVDREAALRLINDNEVGGALIIPANFTHDYLTGRMGVKLELIKNPAQSIQPAALEELVGSAVTVLNALSRNFQAQFPDWPDAFEGPMDHRRIAIVVERVGDRMEVLKKYIDPPLVSYEKEGNGKKTEADPEPEKPGLVSSARKVAGDGENKPAKAEKRPTPDQKKSAPAVEPKPKPASNFSKIFAWVLPGMAAMFLLFLANNAMTDLYREMRFRTVERYQTLREHLLPFVASKVVFAVVFLLICGAVILGGGGMIFRVAWQQPLALATLVVAYACSATAIMTLLVALVPDERRAATLNSVVGMILGFAGGCMFPARQLPQFIREYVTPLLPTHWFVEAAHQLQDGNTVAWGWLSLKFLGLSAGLITLAVVIFQRRFKQGLRA